MATQRWPLNAWIYSSSSRYQLPPQPRKEEVSSTGSPLSPVCLAIMSFRPSTVPDPSKGSAEVFYFEWLCKWVDTMPSSVTSVCEMSGCNFHGGWRELGKSTWCCWDIFLRTYSYLIIFNGPFYFRIVLDLQKSGKNLTASSQRLQAQISLLSSYICHNSLTNSHAC